MRICNIEDLHPGMMLGKSLFKENGQLLLRAGFKLNTEIIGRVQATGRHAVFILEEGTEEILPDEIISEETRSRATQSLSKALENIESTVKERKDVPPDKLRIVIERDVDFHNIVDVNQISTEVSSIVDEIVESGREILDQPSMKSHTGYPQEHAIDTTLTAVLIGKKLQYSRRDLLELGMGAFLHDLGKMAFPFFLTKRPIEYKEEESLMIREHPVFGQVMFARSTDRFFLAQTAILHHHERQDGLGYPLGVRGTNEKPLVNGRNVSQLIFPLAEIITVTDAYDNFIAGRRNPRCSPEHALIEIMKSAGSSFNREVVKLLASIISLFPTGSMVCIAECSNKHLIGSKGAVMKPNPEQPHYPLIVLLQNSQGSKVTPKTVNLAEEEHVLLEIA